MKDVYINLLRYLDGKEEPSRELIQFAHTCGTPHKLHQNFKAFMMRAGWYDGGATTNEDALLTPHVRDWDLYVDAQRVPLAALFDMKIEAQYTDEEEAE